MGCMALEELIQGCTCARMFTCSCTFHSDLFLSIVSWLWMSRLFQTNYFIAFIFLSVCPTRTLSHSLFLLSVDSLHLWFCPIYSFPHFWDLSITYLLAPIRLVHVLFPRIYPTLPDLYYHCLEFCRLMPDHMIVHWPRQLHVWWQSNHPRWYRFLSCLLSRLVSQCQLFMYYVWRQLALSCQPLLHLRLFWARPFTGRTRSLSCWIFFCWALYISLSNERHIMVFLLPSFCHVSYPTQVHVSHSLFCRIFFLLFCPFFPGFFASCFASSLCFSFYCCFISVLHVRKRFLFFPFLRWLTSFPALERLFVFFFSPYVTLVFDAWLSSSAPLSPSA